MKVLVQFEETGKYRDQAWEPLQTKQKGEISAVTPSYAVKLIENNQASLVTSDDQYIFIEK